MDLLRRETGPLESDHLRLSVQMMEKVLTTCLYLSCYVKLLIMKNLLLQIMNLNNHLMTHGELVEDDIGFRTIHAVMSQNHFSICLCIYPTTLF